MKKLILIAILLVTVFPAVAVNISTGSTVASRYVWRGILVNDQAVFQPDVSISGNGFTFDVWGNMDLGNRYNNQFNLDEVDYTFSYDWQTAGTGWSAGIISYTFPHTDSNSTKEVFLGISMSNRMFSPSVTAYYDFDQVNGLYLKFGLSHQFENRLSVEMSMGCGSGNYVRGYFVSDKHTGSTLTDFSVSLNYPVKLKVGELDLSLTESNLLNSDIHTPAFIHDDSNLIFSATWSFNF
ncbi:MAG: hypothetical protein GXO69_10805 [Acidobacteria bacterium]|nr:hypothetical protein [Acidobacteriota bacterium]